MLTTLDKQKLAAAVQAYITACDSVYTTETGEFDVDASEAADNAFEKSLRALKLFSRRGPIDYIEVMTDHVVEIMFETGTSLVVDTQGTAEFD